MKSLALAGVAVCALAIAAPKAEANTNVGLELALLIDVSGSVDNGEYLLQRNGYVQAFQSAAVQNAILNSQMGNIAVTFIEWSGAGQQSQQVGWTLIDSAASSNAFAAAIAGTTRSYSGLTAPGSAINFVMNTAPQTFASNAFDGLRQVIDVSGDGEQNDGANTATARNNALAAGVDAINGLAIGNNALLTWYQNNIVGGAGAFAIQVNDFADFADAIQQKLVREITGVPEPATLALFGAGLAGLGLVARRRRKAA